MEMKTLTCHSCRALSRIMTDGYTSPVQPKDYKVLETPRFCPVCGTDLKED